MKLISVEHTPCIYESAYTTVGLYSTKKAAIQHMCRLKYHYFNQGLNILELNDEFELDFTFTRIKQISEKPMESFRYRIFIVEDL